MLRSLSFGFLTAAVFSAASFHLEGTVLPYYTDFTDGYSLGLLDGQDGWTANDQVEVRQAGDLDGYVAQLEGLGEMRRIFPLLDFRSGAVWFEFFVKLAGQETDGTVLVSAGDAVIKISSVSGETRAFAFDGARETWVSAHIVFPQSAGADTWFSVVLKDSCEQGTYDLFVDGREMLSGIRGLLPLRDDAVEFEVRVAAGEAAVADLFVWIDDFGAFVDVDAGNISATGEVTSFAGDSPATITPSSGDEYFMNAKTVDEFLRDSPHRNRILRALDWAESDELIVFTPLE